MRIHSLLPIFSLLLLASASFLNLPQDNPQLDPQDFAQPIPQDPLSFIPFQDVVKPLGYPVEVHKITTEDGYILTFFRIQAKNKKKLESGLPVVYLQHGLIDSADSWVINGDNAPGLRLADEGYDVWLGNSRGNKYSMEHLRLSPKEKKFWQFSFQHMAQYDLPAAFEYINKHTDGQLINYIGHSQGTTIMFAALSERDPTVTKYLRKYIALSPVAWVAHVKCGIIYLSAYTPLPELYEAFHLNYCAPPNFLESTVGHVYCKALPKVCGYFMSYFYGTDPEHDNYDIYNVMLQHFPSGTSVFNIRHWRQLALENKFNKYDYGIHGNMEHYNQTYPPDYNVSNINVPMHLFFGYDDNMVSEKDSTKLLKALQGNPGMKFKEYPADHLTFLLSKDLSFFFGDLLEILKSDE